MLILKISTDSTNKQYWPIYFDLEICEFFCVRLTQFGKFYLSKKTTSIINVNVKHQAIVIL